MKKKWDRSAMRFASVKYVAHRDVLDVKFENGESFLVPTEAVLVPGRGTPRANGAAPVSPRWSKMRIGETGDVLEVPAGKTVIEIPWDRIRSVSDPDFRAFWIKRTAQRFRFLGGRIRRLRLESGLSRADLAEKLDLPKEKLVLVEAGKLEPSPDLLKQIAQSLGKRLRDFSKTVS
jgi:DNA-binding XRE family transcriptional regulator